MNATISLSSAAYTSRHFERIFESFRPRFGEGFRFTITPDVADERVAVHTNDEALANEIIDALEAAV